MTTATLRVDAPQPASAARAQPPPPVPVMPFLPYLEGLRGLAALYVVLYHVVMTLDGVRPGASSLIPFNAVWLKWGHFAVALFIVISGYVLALPVVVRGSLSGGLRGFFARRARRLLPGYYAALVLAMPFWIAQLRFTQDDASPLRIAGSFAAHAILLHNVSQHTIQTIDGPLWSVAVECQIYLVFAFVLLPVVRRFGIGSMVAVAFAIGLLPLAIGTVRQDTPRYALDDSCYWYVGLFALGSAAAYVAHSTDSAFARLRERLPWRTLWTVAAVVFVALAYDRVVQEVPPWEFWQPDIALGFAAAIGFVILAIRPGGRVASRTIGSLSSKPCILLGTFSYSLYLIHFPILVTVMQALSTTALTSPQIVLLCYAVVVPAIVALAYAFSLAFERPFVSGYRRRKDESLTERLHSAVVSNAEAATSG